MNNQERIKALAKMRTVATKMRDVLRQCEIQMTRRLDFAEILDAEKELLCDVRRVLEKAAKFDVDTADAGG